MNLDHLKIDLPMALIVKFCKSHHISKLSLFGSVLTDHFSEESDVDFLVEFDPDHIPGLFNFIEMKEELALIIGREVDLRTPEDLSKFFRKEVLEKSYLIYG